MAISKKQDHTKPITAETIKANPAGADQNNQVDLPMMLSIRQAVEKTNLSYEFLRYLCGAGKIKCFKYGRKYMINAGSLAEFIENGCDIRKPSLK